MEPIKIVFSNSKVFLLKDEGEIGNEFRGILEELGNIFRCNSPGHGIISKKNRFHGVGVIFNHLSLMRKEKKGHNHKSPVLMQLIQAERFFMAKTSDYISDSCKMADGKTNKLISRVLPKIYKSTQSQEIYATAFGAASSFMKNITDQTDLIDPIIVVYHHDGKTYVIPYFQHNTDLFADTEVLTTLTTNEEIADAVRDSIPTETSGANIILMGKIYTEHIKQKIIYKSFIPMEELQETTQQINTQTGKKYDIKKLPFFLNEIDSLTINVGIVHEETNGIGWLDEHRFIFIDTDKHSHFSIEGYSNKIKLKSGKQHWNGKQKDWKKLAEIVWQIYSELSIQ